jgi:hypothetical protein
LYNGSEDVLLGKEKPMADDFLPRADQEFCAWVKHFLQGASRAERLARLGLKQRELEQLQALRGLQADFENALAAQMQLQRQAIAARFSKDDPRRRCESMARQLAVGLGLLIYWDRTMHRVYRNWEAKQHPTTAPAAAP